MFNKTLNIVKKINLLFIIPFFLFSCSEDVKLTFKEHNISLNENAVIDINYPKAEGNKTVADIINKTVESFIVNQISMTEDSVINGSIATAVKQFDIEYINFKNAFLDSDQKWEALIDGEVTYESPELISIAINSYLDTGGAHGNVSVQFFNFNPQNGDILTKKDLITDMKGFSNVVEHYFKQETEAPSDDESLEDFFFGEDFQLPESIGFTDEGVIILYNTYEIASYAQGITEFTIPYDDITSFLNFN
jgi:hypothetical protein